MGRLLESDSENAVKGIEHAEGVAQVLRHNVVQGKKVEGREALKLRINKDTERGDNDNVKNPKGKNGVVKVGGA
jgi:complex III assembly factor LYRM7